MNIKPNEECKVALIEFKHYKFRYDKPDTTAAVSTYTVAAGHSENVEITKMVFYHLHHHHPLLLLPFGHVTGIEPVL